MCRKLLLILMVLGFVGSVQAAVVTTWEFDNNTNDTTGSNHGSVSGTASYVSPVDDWNGGTGKAFHFDEATQVADTSTSNLPLKMTGAYAIRGVEFSMNVYAKADAGNTFSDWDSIAGFGGQLGERSIMSRGSTNVYFHGYTHNVSSSGIPWTSNGWHMITFTFDQSGYPTFYGDETMWVDGVVVHSSNNVHMPDCTDDDLWAGWNSYRTGGDYWEGDVDGFQIWDSPLSQSDVDTLYERIPEPVTIALLGLGGLALLRRKR